MIIKPIKTRILKPPKDDLLNAIKQSIKKIPEKSILVIASKVVSIWQGRCIAKSEVKSKKELVIKESDLYLPSDNPNLPWGNPGKRRGMLAIKNNILIGSAGIDASNANDFYILWPRQPQKTARKIYQWLRKNYKTKNLGIIIVDSHSIPLRRGTVGVALGYWGFKPIKDYRKEKDLFGRKFIFTQNNIADSLATAALSTMGEGKEQTPLALITDIPFVKFTTKPKKSKRPFSSLEVPLSEDIFFPLVARLPWKKGQQ